MSCPNCGQDFDRLYVKSLKHKTWRAIGHICLTCGIVELPKHYRLLREEGDVYER